jgi:hypothetical protein
MAETKEKHPLFRAGVFQENYLRFAVLRFAAFFTVFFAAFFTVFLTVFFAGRRFAVVFFTDFLAAFFFAAIVFG